MAAYTYINVIQCMLLGRIGITIHNNNIMSIYNHSQYYVIFPIPILQSTDHQNQLCALGIMEPLSFCLQSPVSKVDTLGVAILQTGHPTLERECTQQADRSSYSRAGVYPAGRQVILL